MRELSNHNAGRVVHLRWSRLRQSVERLADRQNVNDANVAAGLLTFRDACRKNERHLAAVTTTTAKKKKLKKNKGPSIEDHLLNMMNMADCDIFLSNDET